MAAIVVASRIRFDSDVTRLDGITPDVRQNEKDFQKNWSNSDADLAILVVTGKTREEAEEANDAIYKLVSPHFPEGQFTSLSSIWPAPATRAANEERWRQFWTPERIAKLRKDLTVAGARYGFSAEAFEPFFQSLSNASSKAEADEGPEQILSSVEEQFVARSGDDWQMLSYFADTPENTATVRALIAGRPEAQIVSRGVLSRAFKETAISETRLLVAISAVFIAIALLVLTRSVIRSIIIMLPVAVGLVAMLATLETMSLSMSVVTVVASIIVLALTSDYGVFALYACENDETILGQGMASVHLSFATTLVGTGVMIFAHHPALFLVGVSLTSGLVAGYLTAFLVIPGIYYLMHRSRPSQDASAAFAQVSHGRESA